MLRDAALSVALAERRLEPLATELAASVGTVLYLDDGWAEQGSGAHLECDG